VGERLSGWVAATGQAALNSDARLDLDEQERAASRFQSALVVRIESKGQVLGVLGAYACEADAFTPSHQRLLQAAAATFAAAARQIFSSTQDFPIAS
jgi:GAF domain-containing protein